MASSTEDKNIPVVLIVLAIAQVIGWGTVGLPATTGRQIAADLHIGIPTVFAGNSVFYIVMGLAAPLLARVFAQAGARLVMIAGTVIATPGFLLLSIAHGPLVYFFAWIVLGLGGSATLSTAAYIALNEVAGSKTKSAIAALMLVTGLSSSIFWPLTSAVSAEAGWRGTCVLWACLMVCVCLPLYAFGLPRRKPAETGTVIAPQPKTEPSSPVSRGTFHLLSATIALNSFVTFGLASVMIEVLRAVGLAESGAIAFGSALGIVQVGARAIDFAGGGRWDGITTGLLAGLALPAAMLILMTGGGAYWSVAVFILLYGLGSGALAVARATMPLVFYDKADYARAASRIALPFNIMSAIAPPVLAGLLSHFGSNAALGLAATCACGAFVLLLQLSRRRPAPGEDALA